VMATIRTESLNSGCVLLIRDDSEDSGSSGRNERIEFNQVAEMKQKDAV
jgi:hypothetical protein